MNKIACSAITLALWTHIHWALAADAPVTGYQEFADKAAAGNMDNKSEPATKSNMKHVMHKKHMQQACMNKTHMQAMDTDHDGMISKEEFMTFHESAFDSMKQTDGKIPVGDMKSRMKTKMQHDPALQDMKPRTSNANNGDENASSMNDKPIGTTTDSEHLNKRDATNGKQY